MANVENINTELFNSTFQNCSCSSYHKKGESWEPPKKGAALQYCPRQCNFDRIFSQMQIFQQHFISVTLGEPALRDPALSGAGREGSSGQPGLAGTCYAAGSHCALERATGHPAHWGGQRACPRIPGPAGKRTKHGKVDKSINQPSWAAPNKICNVSLL